MKDTVERGDRLIVACANDYRHVVTVNETLLNSKYGSFKLELLVGKRYGFSYELKDNELVEHEATATKELDFKEEKRYLLKDLRRSPVFTLIFLTPQSYLLATQGRTRNDSSVLSLSESAFAYIYYRLRVNSSVFVWDDAAGVVAYSVASRAQKVYCATHGKIKVPEYNERIQTVRTTEEVPVQSLSTVVLAMKSRHQEVLFSLFDKMEPLCSVVVYAQCREQLADSYEYAMKSPNFINVELMNFFTREFYTPKGRLRPEMQQQNQSGYVLTMIRVDSKVTE